jgi:hypothetical protein
MTDILCNPHSPKVIGELHLRYDTTVRQILCGGFFVLEKPRKSVVTFTSSHAYNCKVVETLNEILNVFGLWTVI